MSDPKKSPQSEIIKSRKELLSFLDLPEGYDIPEFQGVVEFTRSELDSLRNSFKGREENALAEELRRIVQERMKSKKDQSTRATTGLTGVALDMLGQEVDQLDQKKFEGKVNAPVFEKLNVRESAEKQKEMMLELAGTSIFELIPVLLHRNVDVAKIKDMSIFRDSNFNRQLLSAPNPQGNTDISSAFNKIKEILSSDKKGPDSVHDVWQSNWVKMVQKAQEAYPIMKPFMEDAEKKQEERNGTAEKGEEKGGFLDWIKDNPGKTAAIGAGVVLGGILLKNWLSKDKTEGEESSGFFGKLFKGTLIGGGVFFGAGWGLGRLFETETAKGWLEKMGWDNSRIVRALRLFSHGDFKKAWESLWEESEEDKTYKDIADQISKETGKKVSATTIRLIWGKKYNGIFPSNLIDKMKSGTGDWLKGLMINTPGIGSFFEDSPQLKEELPHIAQFLDKHKAEVGNCRVDNDTTVEYVLREVCNKRDPNKKRDITPAGLAEAITDPKAQEIQKEGAERIQKLQDRREKAKSSLASSGEINDQTISFIEKDMSDYERFLEDISSAEETWLKDFWEHVRDATGGQSDNQDFIELREHAIKEHKLKIKELKADIAKCRAALAEYKKNKSSKSPQEIADLKNRINDFYELYICLDSHITSMKAHRTQQLSDRGVFGTAAAGGKLVAHTLWGMAFSVIRGQNNNFIITKLGQVELGVMAAGALYGLFKGRGLIGRLSKGVGWAALFPVYGAGKTWDYADWKLSKSNVLEQVRIGKLTPEQGQAIIKNFADNNRCYIDADGKVQKATDPKWQRQAQNLASPWRNGLKDPQRVELTTQNLELIRLQKQVDAIKGVGMHSEDLGINSNRELLDPYKGLVKGSYHNINDLSRRILEQWGKADGQDHFSDTTQIAKAKRYAVELLAERFNVELKEVEGLTDMKVKVIRAKQMMSNFGEFVKTMPEQLGSFGTRLKALGTKIYNGVKSIPEMPQRAVNWARDIGSGKRVPTPAEVTLSAAPSEPLRSPTNENEAPREAKVKGASVAAGSATHMLLEKFNDAMLVYGLIMSIKSIHEIKNAKAKLEETRKALLQANPQDAELINKAMDEQVRIIQYKEIILSGQITGTSLALLNKAHLLKQIPGFDGKFQSISKLGRLAGPVFITVGLADLAVYNFVEMPVVRKQIEELGKTAEQLAKQGLISKEQLEETVRLLKSQGSLATERQIVSNIDKILGVTAIIAGSATLTVAAIAASPYMYMYNTAMSSREDACRTALQWASKEKDVLIHDWVTSGFDQTAAEAYRLTTSYEKIQEEKTGTRQRILEALFIREGESPERVVIRKNYIKMLTGGDYASLSYDRAKTMINDSKAFADTIATYEASPSSLTINPKYAQKIPQVIEQAKKLDGNVDMATAIHLANSYKRTLSPEQKENLSSLSALQRGVYSLAKYLDYSGANDMSSLQQFFDEAHKEQRGIYWNGEQWLLNQPSWRRDIRLGNDNATIQRMITEMTDHKDDILTHRLSAMTDLMKTQAEEVCEQKVMSMVNVLQESLKG